MAIAGIEAMRFLAGLLAALFLCATPFETAAAAPEKATADASPEMPGLVAEDSRLLVIFANPVEGQEAGFNAWYDQHMRDFMKLPSFMRVQKFKMLSRKGRPDPAFRYMLLYEFKGDQDAALAEVQAAMKQGRMQAPDPRYVAKIEGMNYAADGIGYRGPVPPVHMETGFVPEDSKLLVVFANPVEGQVPGFETWYDQHIRDFMKFPNYVRVQKFKMLSRKGEPAPAYQYLFIHEFKGDQDVSFAQTQAAMKDGRTQMPDPKVVAKVEGMNYAPDGIGYRNEAGGHP